MYRYAFSVALAEKLNKACRWTIFLSREPFSLRTQNSGNQIPMKTRLQILAVIAISLLTVGCASAIKEKQNLAIAAGFKAITPVKPEHIELLPKLPKNTMS